MAGYRPKGRYTFTLQEGDAFEQVMVVPNAISLSGKDLKLQARKTATDPDLVLELSTDDGTITKSGQNITLIFAPTATDGKAGRYVWDLKVYSSPTDVITLARGDMEIEPSVTDL